MEYLCFQCLYTETRVSSDDWTDEWHYCKVVDVYDGDTCTVKLRRNGQWIEQKLRMYGYDSPERKPLKTHPNREIEILLANKAKDHFQSLVNGRILCIHTTGREKYGRILAHMYHVNMFGRPVQPSINTQMIDIGHGRLYFGGSKEPV